MKTKNFTKGIIEQEVEKWRYEVRDLVDGTLKTMAIIGNRKIHIEALGIKPGKAVYIIKDEFFPREDWRLLITTDFKMDQKLFGMKIELDQFLEAQGKG